ncbi:MAG: ATP-binding protein [Bacteroidota bacterium]
MIYQRFRFNVVFRVCMITLGIFLVIYIWEIDSWPPTRLLLISAIVGLVVELIHYVEKTNRDLRNFLLAIKHKDFTLSFSTELRGKTFSGMREAFNQIMDGYQELRAEKESHYQYLQNVVEHVSTAVICYTDEGEVELLNRSAQELLDRPYMSNIKTLNRISPALLTAMEDITLKEKKLIKVVINDQLMHLAIQSTQFKLQDTNYKLVSLQNIQSELDEQEVETWQKLIRVLTHEIMNSVTPIISLTKVLRGLVSDGGDSCRDLSELDVEDQQDLLNSIRTIESRSKGLLHFVHAYRSLTKIQKPQFQSVIPKTILDHVVSLLSPELKKRNIIIRTHILDPQLHIQADTKLIEQVLINLVKNCMEALNQKQHGNIDLIVKRSSEGRPMIQVQDNGKGINPEYADKVFIPFFTTKKRGSGIGLSLSRQIMRLHQGSIHFHSSPDEGTTFSLLF